MTDFQVSIPDAGASAPAPATSTPSSSGGNSGSNKSLHSQLLDDIPDTPKDTARKEKDRVEKPGYSPDPKDAKAEKSEKPETKVRKPEKAEEASDGVGRGQGDEQPKPKPEPKLLKLKAKGKEIDFDISDDARTKAMLEKGFGADEVFEHAAKMRKQVERYYAMMKSVKDNPAFLERIFSDPSIGVDFKQVAKDYVYSLIQEENELAGLTEEQRQWRESHKRLQSQQREQEWEGAREQEELSREEKAKKQAIFEDEYEAKITEALQVKGIPKTHRTVAEMSWYIEQALENNKDVSPHEIADYILSKQGETQRSNIDAMDEDGLARFLGEENLAKLRKYELRRLKSQTSQPFKSPEKKQPSNSQGNQVKSALKKLSSFDWGEDVRKGFLAQFN